MEKITAQMAITLNLMRVRKPEAQTATGIDSAANEDSNNLWHTALVNQCKMHRTWSQFVSMKKDGNNNGWSQSWSQCCDLLYASVK